MRLRVFDVVPHEVRVERNYSETTLCLLDRIIAAFGSKMICEYDGCEG